MTGSSEFRARASAALEPGPKAYIYYGHNAPPPPSILKKKKRKKILVYRVNFSNLS